MRKTALLAGWLGLLATLYPGCAHDTAPASLPASGPTASTEAVFFGVKQSPADAVVYVLDDTGSMLDTFDEIKKELIHSVSRLGADQKFHVLFLRDGPPRESPPRKLVLATEENKQEAIAFINTIQPSGQTDAIPAMKRAFEVLADLSILDFHGKAIYLLTDGEFYDNMAVRRTIAELNRYGRNHVHVHTILHYHKSPGAISVLKDIARDNRGEFKFVAPEE